MLCEDNDINICQSKCESSACMFTCIDDVGFYCVCHCDYSGFDPRIHGYSSSFPGVMSQWGKGTDRYVLEKVILAPIFKIEAEERVRNTIS